MTNANDVKCNRRWLVGGASVLLGWGLNIGMKALLNCNISPKPKDGALNIGSEITPKYKGLSLTYNF